MLADECISVTTNSTYSIFMFGSDQKTLLLYYLIARISRILEDKYFLREIKKKLTSADRIICRYNFFFSYEQ